jgi:hypothetical protein
MFIVCVVFRQFGFILKYYILELHNKNTISNQHVIVTRKGNDNHIMWLILLLQLENEFLCKKETGLHMEYQQLLDKNVKLTGTTAELTTKLNEVSGCLAAKQEDLTSCMNCLTVRVNSMLVM